MHTHKQKLTGTKEERRKKMLLLGALFVENLTGYNDIVCEFAVYF